MTLVRDDMMPIFPRPTVFVDFHGTICNDRYWRSLPNQYQQPLQLFLFQENSHLVEQWMRGRHTAEAINEMVAAELGLPYDAVWNDFVADCQSMQVSPAILSRLERLRPFANIVLMTGNMDSFTRFTVPALGLDAYFDAISNSFDEGRLKTDNGGALFGHYARRFDTRIEQCVVIDDADDVCTVFSDLGGRALQVTLERPTEMLLDGLLLSWSHEALPQSDRFGGPSALAKRR